MNRNFIIIGSVFVSAIASADDSKNLDYFLHQIDQNGISDTKMHVAQLDENQLSSLHSDVGSANLGKCIVVDKGSTPFVAIGSLVSSIGLEIVAPFQVTWSMIFDGIPGYQAWSFYKMAADAVNPASLYKIFNEDIHKSLNCKNIGNLHQIVMDEVSYRQNIEVVNLDATKAVQTISPEGQRSITFSLKSAGAL
jgi:hypothetical protein